MDLTLPYVCLQPDYLQAYNDVAQSLHAFENVWLSVYCLNAPSASIHTKLLLASAKGGEVEVELEESAKGVLRVRQCKDSSMDLVVASTSAKASHEARQTSSSIYLPSTTIRLPRKSAGPVVQGSLGVTAFDISPDNAGRYVVGGADGQAHIGSLGISTADSGQDVGEREADAGLDDMERLARQRIARRNRERAKQERTLLEGHVGDIRSARFFPSGEVVLTTSSDCTARIFGLDGSNPRTLTGHRRGVTSSCMIGRGREVLTSSSDGSTRLWDVGEGVQKRVLASHKFSAVNAVSMGRAQESGENDAHGNLVITGLANGVIEGHDLSTGSSVFQLPKVLFPSGTAPKATDRWEQVSTGAITALDWSRESNMLLAGCTNGVTLLHDIRMLSSTSTSGSSLLSTWRRNGAAVNAVRLQPASAEALLVTADGTPYRVGLLDSTPTVFDEYAGWDIDNVTSISLDARSHVWMGGADGCLRMY